MKQPPKTILITGAGSGIGKDTALFLARCGHHVIATTETEEQAKNLTSESDKMDISMEIFKLDVTENSDRLKIAQYPELDVLINNAGIGETGSLAEIPLEKVRHNFEVNVFGPLALTQLALKAMIKRDKGTVIFISSTAGRIPIPFFAPYGMTKFSLSAGVDALRQELHKISKSIHAVVVEPGAYHTGFNQRMINSRKAWLHEQSYFHSINEKLLKRDHARFQLIETKSTASIVRKIIRAAEADKPRLRYVAPAWQAIGVHILRIFGK